MQDLPFMSFAAAHPSFSDDVIDALNPAKSVLHREVEGGTGPSAVKAQIEAARTVLIPPLPPRSSNTGV